MDEDPREPAHRPVGARPSGRGSKIAARYGAPVATVGSALCNWFRKQVARPRYVAPPAEDVFVDAGDGTRLHAVRLEGPADAVASIVIVHGITNSSRSPRVHAFATEVCTWAHAVVIDLRGHGESRGFCTMGEFEPLDVAAAVRLAHRRAPDLPIVVIGTSLGGLAAVRSGAVPAAFAPAAIAGVVSISAPMRRTIDRPGARRMHRLCATRVGRVALRVAFRTHVRSGWWEVDNVAHDLPGATQGFTIVVHDPDESYFGAEHAQLLYDLSREPKELWWMPGGGHGGDLLTPELQKRLQSEITRRVRLPD